CCTITTAPYRPIPWWRRGAKAGKNIASSDGAYGNPLVEADAAAISGRHARRRGHGGGAHRQLLAALRHPGSRRPPRRASTDPARLPALRRHRLPAFPPLQRKVALRIAPRPRQHLPRGQRVGSLAAGVRLHPGRAQRAWHLLLRQADDPALLAAADVL